MSDRPIFALVFELHNLNNIAQAERLGESIIDAYRPDVRVDMELTDVVEFNSRKRKSVDARSS